MLLLNKNTLDTDILGVIKGILQLITYGVSKRKRRTTVKMDRCLLFDKNHPKAFR